MAIARIFDPVCLALRASMTMAPLRYAAKLPKFDLSLDCLGVEGGDEILPSGDTAWNGDVFCEISSYVKNPLTAVHLPRGAGAVQPEADPVAP